MKIKALRSFQVTADLAVQKDSVVELSENFALELIRSNKAEPSDAELYTAPNPKAEAPQE